MDTPVEHEIALASWYYYEKLANWTCRKFFDFVYCTDSFVMLLTLDFWFMSPFWLSFFSWLLFPLLLHKFSSILRCHLSFESLRWRKAWSSRSTIVSLFLFQFWLWAWRHNRHQTIRFLADWLHRWSSAVRCGFVWPSAESQNLVPHPAPFELLLCLFWNLRYNQSWI